jgi:fibronectin type 3 domain-containing protein
MSKQLRSDKLGIGRRLAAWGVLSMLMLCGCGGVGTSSSKPSSPPAPSSPTVPDAPVDLQATGGNSQVALTWGASTGATGYQVQRSTDGGGPYAAVGSPTASSYADTGVTNGTTYYYVVVAINDAGDSAASAQASATPDAATAAPSVPSGLLSSAGNAQVGLTWTVSTGATSYHVKRATVSGGPFSVIATETSASYVDTGLANGTAYYYVVSALNSAGESANSAQVSATPAATAASGPAAVCLTPFTEDKSATTVTVGTGTAASCTEAALASALAKGGVIRFSCGGAATITLTSQKTLRTDVNTTLDGGGQITLDGGGTTRLLYYYSANFQATKTTVTIQNITLQNGASSGTPIPVAPAPCSQGTQNDGGGAAIYMRDGILHVWNTVFKNNVGPAVGPDVSGGAIYTLGSLGTTIVGSTFQSNRAANGGAIGALFGDLSIYNSQFSSNQATGNGANSINSACHVNGGESGNGGSGGAVGMDGAEVYAVNVCGSTFTSNAAGVGALGGAISRTPDAAPQTTTIDRSSFVGNTAPSGGALYFHNSNLVITASTLSGNTASGSGGAVFADTSTLAFTNDTFADNISQKGLGGSIVLFGNGGTLQNLTFVGNQAAGGSGYFGAAIAGGTPLTISNTLFSANTTEDCGSPMACSAAGSTGLDDLQWPATHSVCSTADVACTSGTVFSNPQLGVLQSNGGPTQTVAPLPGSPALGIGQKCPATDQRGVARPASGCTAGAVQGAVLP